MISCDKYSKLGEHGISSAIHQPHYFPWMPYINNIASVDVFIIFDTVQLPRGKSRVLRAKYLDQQGEKWLTIPFGKKGDLLPIREVRLEDLSWKKSHIEKLKNAYRQAPYAEWALDIVQEALWPNDSHFLVDIEQKMLEILCCALDIKTKIIRASELLPYDGMRLQEYIIGLLEAAGAGTYLTGEGKGSKKTIDESLFQSKGIRLEYQDYQIRPYQHCHGQEFIQNLSILDPLFCLGKMTQDHVHNITG